MMEPISWLIIRTNASADSTGRRETLSSAFISLICKTRLQDNKILFSAFVHQNSNIQYMLKGKIKKALTLRPDKVPLNVPLGVGLLVQGSTADRRCTLLSAKYEVP